MSARGEIVYAVLRHVRPLTLNSARVVATSLRAEGVTVAMRAVLEILDGAGPLPVPSIAETLSCSRQAAQRIVNELREHGFVEVRTNPVHRRSVLIALTPAGRSAFERIHDAELEELGRMLSGFSREEIALAERVLAALDDDVRRRATGEEMSDA